MIDFGASGRAAGVSLLALLFGLTSATPVAAKDVPGRKRCFVAGVETYKDEPVYRDKSSGYQRVQVPGSKGERCFWEPLDYQEAAAAAPVRPSRAAPSITGRHARAAAEPRPAPPRTEEAPAPAPDVPSQTHRPSAQEPAAPQRLAALPPQPEPRTEPRRQASPEPRPAPQLAPEPERRAAAPPEPRPAPQPAPEPERRAAAPPEPAKPEPVTPVLQPKGLTSGGASGGLDLRIQTRPVTSGGMVSTVSSGPEIQSLMKDDQVIPPADEPKRLEAARSALASLTPRTSVRASEPSASEPSAPPPAAHREQAAAPSSAAAPARKASSGKGGNFVQLGSVTSYQKAKQFWSDVTGRYPEVLEGFSPNIVEADIPEKGIYYRVRVGPMSKGEAKSLCKRLDNNCLVVSR